MIETKSLLENSSDKKRFNLYYFIMYTVAFALTALAVNFVLLRDGVTYVRIVDGVTQHYVALEYYSEWLREIVRTFLTEHRLVIRNFDFTIGMGSDVVTTLNYYAIGDPLNLISIFFPVKYMGICYSVIAIIRYYLAGMAFSLYCFERKHRNTYGVLVSALLYSFGAFAVIAGTNHPFFINPMIYMPLIFIAVEKILKNKNPIYLALIVCIAEVSNFYFFYMLVFATIVYVLIRLFTIYRLQIKKMIAPLFKIGVSAVIGVLLGAVIFYPVALNFLSDGRAGVAHTYEMFYSARYYLMLFSSMIYIRGIEPWTLIGSTVLFIYAIFALFMKRKKYTGLKIAFIICVVGLCVPAFGGFSNGFSYACNRWCFIFTFVLAFMTSLTWDDMFYTDSKLKGFLIAALPALYGGCCVFLPFTVKNRLIFALASFLVMSALFLFANWFVKKEGFKRLVQVAVILVNIACLGMNAYFQLNGETKNHYSQEKITANVSQEYTAVEEQKKKTGETEFSRYTSNKMNLNDATKNGGYGTQYYWSLSNSDISAFQDSVYLNEGFYQQYNGFDDIAALNSLSSVKYYYDKTSVQGSVPFGFEKTETKNLYENKYVLPIAYTYDNYILRQDYDALTTSAEKQQAMLQGAVIEAKTDHVKAADAEYKVTKPDFKVVSGSKYITFKDNAFTVTKKGAYAVLRIKNPVPGEAYVSMRNISYKAAKPADIFGNDATFDPLDLFNKETLKDYDKAKIEKEIGSIGNWSEPQIVNISVSGCEEGLKGDIRIFKYYTPFYRFYAGKKDFDICLGYSEKGYSNIVIGFPDVGIYKFDDISVVVQDMDLYKDSIENLKKESAENVVIGVDSIKADISAERNKLLCFSVPYSKGWSATLDGEEIPVLKANVMHLAVEIPQGDHVVELKYSSPNMKIGALASIFALLLLFVYELWYYTMRRKNRIDFVDVD